MLQQYPTLHLGIPLTEEQGFGFAFRKGSPLVEPISAQLRQLKSSNIYYRLLRKHLGDAAVEAVEAARP
jgi:ABC-type amino acid transport substrate-binding protein